MIARATLLLILLVSCAHAMAHVFELSLPSVEQLVAADYGFGKLTSGLLATTWRLPWGLGALLAGFLVDRFGSRRMLTIYLFGCAAMCAVATQQMPLPALFGVMFMMGLFASIYHPAGLALISHETTAANRPRALGLHGIFGSAGIGAAPFVAGWVLAMKDASWHDYYAVLAAAALALAVVFYLVGKLRPDLDRPLEKPLVVDAEQDHVDWRSFYTLTALAVLMGFTYSAVLSFLPRYLDDGEVRWYLNELIGYLREALVYLQLDEYFEIDRTLPDESLRNFGTAAVLIVGCFGQYAAGRFARPDRLERQLSLVLWCTVPALLWMAVAVGTQRLWAAGLFALVHFMHQPIYNSLIAKYTPRHRRSIAYGFSFAMGLGIGGTGAALVGSMQDDRWIYTILAGIAGGAGTVGIVLWRRSKAVLAA
jgi:FSR family fosmidomycin resistance protein-like MFS transporter